MRFWSVNKYNINSVNRYNISSENRYISHNNVTCIHQIWNPTLRLHKIHYIADNRQVENFHGYMLYSCTIQARLPPTTFWNKIIITVRKPAFLNSCKNLYSFFEDASERCSPRLLRRRTQPTDCSHSSYSTGCSVLDMCYASLPKTRLVGGRNISGARMESYSILNW